MNYFVTGATGFIGKFLVGELLQRAEAKVYVLVRPSSQDKFEALQARFGEAGERLVAVHGDVTEPGLIDEAERKKLKGHIAHVFHLAAVYDMAMSDAQADRINIEGTRHLVEFANGLGGDVHLHHVSSVAVAGNGYNGRFTEDMFDEGQKLEHPYYRSKFQSEKIVREESKVPFRIYRPGVVVGSSESGEMDKIDGPYYFFKTIQKLSYAVPKWLPLLGIEGGKVPIVPVDYVAKAIVTIAHEKGRDGQCFCLIQSKSPSVGDLLQTLLEVAHGPEFARRLELPALPLAMRELAGQVKGHVAGTSWGPAVEKRVSKAIGVPLSVVAYVGNRTVFDDRNTRAALKGTGVQCPDIRDYADKLWQYWEKFLDVETRVPRGAVQKLTGKVAVVTGASRGLGAAIAVALAEAGADVALVARGDVSAAEQAIAALGRRSLRLAEDVGAPDAAARIHDAVLTAFGRADILVNNAGIIRRASVLEFSETDWDDVLNVNLSAAFRLSQRFAAGWVRAGQPGKIVNIASMLSFQGGVRVVSYTAAKSALAGITRAMANELAAHRININAVAPGYMATDNTEALRADPARNRAILDRIPAGRWGEPGDLAGAVVFLASSASDYLHGHVLAVDGGWLAR